MPRDAAMRTILSAPRAAPTTAVAANDPRVAFKNSALLQRRGDPPPLRPCDIAPSSACDKKADPLFGSNNRTKLPLAARAATHTLGGEPRLANTSQWHRI